MARPSIDVSGGLLVEQLLALPDAVGALRVLEERLRARGILFGSRPIPTFLYPHLLDGALFDRWVSETEAFFAILERIARRMVGEEPLLRELQFSDPVRELVRIDPGYARCVVVARPDAVNLGERIQFIEVNSDSPAMMTFADEIEAILFELEPLAALRDRFPPARRVASLLEALNGCYAEYGGGGAPTIAIVDWPGEKTAHELAKTAELFSGLGTEAVVAGPAELSYQGGRLRARERPIDLVYRRVLCRDFVTRAEELAPLIAAYRDGRVCMVNPLRSILVGTKGVLALLRDPDNPAELTREEQKLVEWTVPETRYLVPDEPLERSSWVVKKSESYGGQDVLIGPLTEEALWRRTIAKAEPRSWVRQRLIDPMPTVDLPMLDGQRFRFAPKFFNWNPFLFAGRHGGSITRVSDSPLINISRGGGLLPTLRSPSPGPG